MSSVILLSHTFYHAALILIPIIFFGMLAIQKGIKEHLVILAAGSVGGGLIAYCIFWFSLISPKLGLIGSLSTYVLMLMIGIVKFRSLRNFERLKPFVWPVLTWILYTLFILSAGFAPAGLSDPMNTAAVRFSHALPIDNQLPLIFAQQILSGKISIPMIGDWLSSDRPPMQTAYYLFSGAAYFSDLKLNYQVQATLLQCLWIIAMWAFLVSRNVDRWLSNLVLLVLMFSGTALVHGLFTWPKLFPAFYILLLYAILFHQNNELQRKWGYGALVGCLCAFAMLCHGGSIFALIGIGLAMLITKRLPGISFAMSAVISSIAILVTWTLYQGVIDPPGNRLLKWHLAGVIPIDSRSFMETLIQSYQALGFSEILDYKLANLLTVFGSQIDFIKKLLLALAGNMELQGLIELRDRQFFTVWAAWGILSVTVFLVVFAPFYEKSPEKSLGLELLLVGFLIIIVWVILLFGPDGTVIHQGSLFMMFCLLGGSIIYCYSLNKYLAIGTATIHLYTTYLLYLSYGWEIENVPVDNSLVYLAILSILLGTAPFIYLFKITGSEKYK